MIKIVSIKMVCTLDQPLDLLMLSMNLEGAILPKKLGNWVKFRIKPENYFIEFYKSDLCLRPDFIRFQLPNK